MKAITILSIVMLFSLATFAQANDQLNTALELANKRDYAAAIERLSSLGEESEDHLARFHLARLQLRTGEARAAEQTLETLIASHPEIADVHYLMGLVQLTLIEEVSIFRKLGKAKASMNAWQQAIKMDPEHIDSHFAIFGWYTIAPGIAGGDLQKADQLIPKIEAMDPGYGALARAMLYNRKEDHQAAESAYLEAIDLMQRAGPHFSIAQHYLAREQWQQALTHLDKFEQKEKRWWDPDITVTHLLKARAHAGLGDGERAEQIITAALAMNPNKRIKAGLKEILNSL